MLSQTCSHRHMCSQTCSQTDMCTVRHAHTSHRQSDIVTDTMLTLVTNTGRQRQWSTAHHWHESVCLSDVFTPRQMHSHICLQTQVNTHTLTVTHAHRHRLTHTHTPTQSRHAHTHVWHVRKRNTHTHTCICMNATASLTLLKENKSMCNENCGKNKVLWGKGNLQLTATGSTATMSAEKTRTWTKVMCVMDPIAPDNISPYSDRPQQWKHSIS